MVEKNDQLQALLNRLYLPLMEEAGMDIDADWDWPIAEALRVLGYETANIASVTDDEVDNVSSDDWHDMVLLSRYFALQQIQGNLALVDTTVGPRSEKLSQLGQQISDMILALESQIGVFSKRSVGKAVINLGFVEDEGR